MLSYKEEIRVELGLFRGAAGMKMPAPCSPLSLPSFPWFEQEIKLSRLC